MIYTGYYAQMKKYVAEGLTPVSIAGWAPAFYKGIEYKKLAPKYGFFSAWKRGELTDDDYVKYFYVQVLNSLNPHKVALELELLAGDKIVLLCYEKPSDFCHRHIVAEWFNANGIDAKEFVVVDKKKNV